MQNIQHADHMHVGSLNQPIISHPLLVYFVARPTMHEKQACKASAVVPR
jgi:hypothetical protein